MLDIKSILKVISSNFIVLVSGIIITFILPKMVTPLQYGYYSLFNLYVSYAGITLLGYVDGIYLKYGGKSYEKLNKEEFSTYFWKIIIWEIVFLVIASLIIICSQSGEKLNVLLFTAFGVMLECASSYFMNIDKMTSRFSIYAKENVLYKVLIFIFIIICLLFKIKIYEYLFFGLIIFKIITLIYQMYNSRKIIFTKPNLIKKEYFKYDLENIKVGSILMISLVCTMLMTGFGKFLVESKLGIEQLGYYSFMFSIMSLFTLIINSVSTVLYPQMRNMTLERSSQLTESINKVIELIAPFVLLCYYPCVILIFAFFKSYINTIDCLLFLFPIIIIQTKISIIYNNYYKVMRKEKNMLVNTAISILICIIITIIGFKLSPSIGTVALSTFISYKIWEIINLVYFRKNKYLKIKYIGLSDIIIVLYFVLMRIFATNMIIQALLMLTIYILVLIYNRKNIKKILSIMKERGN